MFYLKKIFFEKTYAKNFKKMAKKFYKTFAKRLEKLKENFEMIYRNL